MNEIDQILNIMKNLKSLYFYLNSDNGDYITLYYINISINFVSLYRFQNYRYTELYFNSLTFLNK